MSVERNAFDAALDAVVALQQRIEDLDRLRLLQRGNVHWLREQVSDLYDSIERSRAKIIEGKETGR